MHFNLVKLETFYWVVRLGSFARAAAHMHTTPPSITMRIQQLEDELGCRLIDRSGRERRPTLHGARIFDHVEQILKSLDDLEAIARRRDPGRACLRLGVVELVAMTWITAIVSHIQSRFRAFKLELGVDLALPLVEALESGELDAIIAPFRPTSPQFQSQSVGFVRYGWFAPGSIPDGLDEAELLANWPIARLVGSFPCEHALRATLSTGRADRVVICNHLMAIRAMVTSGAAIGVLPELLMRDAIADGSAREIQIGVGFPEAEMFLSCAFDPFSETLTDLLSTFAGMSAFASRSRHSIA